MELPDIGNNCLAKIDGKYNRAKILNNYCENGIFRAEVFCCDIGSIGNCDIENIMCIPDSMVSALPFQAIRCRLYGVKSIELGDWPEKTSLKIYDDIIDPIRHLRVKMISLHEVKPIIADSPFKMQVINVVLMSDTCTVNREIVDREWAIFEIGSKEIMDSNYEAPVNTNSELDSDDIDDEDSEDEEWKEAGIVRQLTPVKPTMPSDSDLMQSLNDGTLEVEFNIGEFTECMDESILHLFQIPKAIEEELKNLDTLKKEKKPKMLPSNLTSDSDNCEEISYKQQSINKLQYKYRVPYVMWRQSDELIVLTIKADENVVYNLDVTRDRLIFK